jgi:hypothetical protein
MPGYNTYPDCGGYGCTENIKGELVQCEYCSGYGMVEDFAVDTSLTEQQKEDKE